MTGEKKFFPILKGESVGESGEFSGYVVIVESPEELSREWKASEIAVIKDDMESHFESNPGDIDSLFEKVTAVIAEFGEPIGDFASIAHVREAILIVKALDATYVLEDGMHITVAASENLGEIYFID